MWSPWHFAQKSILKPLVWTNGRIPTNATWKVFWVKKGCIFDGLKKRATEYELLIFFFFCFGGAQQRDRMQGCSLVLCWGLLERGFYAYTLVDKGCLKDEVPNWSSHREYHSLEISGTSCDVTACKFCDYPTETGHAHCKVCFVTQQNLAVFVKHSRISCHTILIHTKHHSSLYVNV